jgi:ABC-type branched-subunit amino acid transport system substrate-binding protein
MRTGTTARSIAIAGAALLALTACGGGGDEGGDTGAEGGGEKQVNIYGTDGNMGNALGEDFDDANGALAGMSGTTPLTDLASDFTDRLKQVDPNLKDFNYAGESYDAAVLVALAAQMAGSNQATAFAPYINGITFGGDKCSDFASCLEIINAGGNPDYDGVTGPLSFADAGEPAQASFGILHFEDDNTIDPANNDYVIAGDEANAATDEGPAPVPPGATSEPLVIGYLLPQTGDLAFLGPPEEAGVALAVNDINAAGGALGQ